MNIFMNAIHTEEHKLPNGKVLVGVIEYDNEATNPRTWSNLGTIMVAPQKSHWVGNTDELVDMSIELGNNPYEHWENIRREQLGLKKSEIAFDCPITKYEHSEISLSLGYKQGWDYGVIGFIYVTKEQVRQWYGVKHITKAILEKVENCLEVELGVLSSWLNGDCYGYRVYEVEYDELGDIAEYKALDSCWGFIGSKDYCQDELQDTIAHILATSDAHA